MQAFLLKSLSYIDKQQPGSNNTGYYNQYFTHMDTPDKQLGKDTEQKQDKPKRSTWIRPATALTFATALAVSTVANIAIRSYLGEPEAPETGQFDKEEELKRLKDEIEYKKGILEIQDMEEELLKMEEELNRKMLKTLQGEDNPDWSSTLDDSA